MPSYIGIIHKDTDSDYGVSFPDFPGCITGGSTLDEAGRMAQEALALHVAGMREDGEAIPDPMPLDEARAHEFAQDAAAFIVVAIPDEAPKYVRISITVPEDALARIDSYSKAHGIPRSTFLVQAAARAMQAGA